MWTYCSTNLQLLWYLVQMRPCGSEWVVHELQAVWSPATLVHMSDCLLEPLSIPVGRPVPRMAHVCECMWEPHPLYKCSSFTYPLVTRGGVLMDSWLFLQCHLVFTYSMRYTNLYLTHIYVPVRMICNHFVCHFIKKKFCCIIRLKFKFAQYLGFANKYLSVVLSLYL